MERLDILIAMATVDFDEAKKRLVEVEDTEVRVVAADRHSLIGPKALRRRHQDALQKTKERWSIVDGLVSLNAELAPGGPLRRSQGKPRA